jgi:hypothetical protein
MKINKLQGMTAAAAAAAARYKRTTPQHMSQSMLCLSPFTPKVLNI